MHSAIIESEGVANSQIVFRNVIFIVGVIDRLVRGTFTSACITFALGEYPIYTAY